ncbi:MAG: hypothetical protein DMG07_18130 [Acidobacteria bacterium]|nr:MAG: hypothetical protein DMG07_18130 [Acidobacteriota bacterium]
MALFPVLALAAGDATKPVALGARRELFVDDFLIDGLRGDARLVLHSPRVAEKVIAFDRPWEGATSGYAVVWKEGERFRMYYRGASQSGYTITSMLRPGESVIPEHPPTTCYAESKDGIHWTKPSLALFDFKGSKENNIVWMGEGSENFSPFLDSSPRAPDSERYKAVASDRVGEQPVLAGFVSADGLHWKRLRPEPLLTDGKFDSLNVVFWDPLREQYVAVYRDFTAGVRTIKYAESKDFRTWSAGQWGDFGTAPMEHLYTNATVPYFRAPQIYLAFPRRFLPWRNFYPDAPSPGASDGVFMSSRDGLHWDRRFLESFIRPGTDPRNWVQRANTPARGVVQTGPDEISLYVERNRVFPTNYLERLVLRTDGFVSVHAGLAGGELVTKPFTFQGSQLMLNYATSAAGSIQLEVQDARGHPLPGFALEESPLIWGDQIDGGVSWRKPNSRTDPEPLKRLAGLPVRLRFVLKDADLYALEFR